MSTIAVTVYDVIAALRGRGCSMREVVESLPDIDREPVSSAVHRLSERVRCRIHHELAAGFIYNIAPGAARPTDGRGRPRKLGVGYSITRGSGARRLPSHPQLQR